MQILLRKYSLDERGKPEINDTELQGEVIVLGSAPDSDLQLLGENIAARHAEITMEQGYPQLKAGKRCRFVFNGEVIACAHLAAGDELRLDNHRINVIDTPPGFDLALQWEPGEVDGSYLANAYRTRLRDTRLHPRAIAWFLALGIIVCAGLIPALAYYLRPLEEQPRAEVKLEADRFLISEFAADTFWLSGPLHSAHQVAVGDNCKACHRRPFEQVTDEACRQCHLGVEEHIPATHADSHLMAGLSCQNCHKEHNEPENLIVGDDVLCVRCHRESAPAVTGFSPHTHPPFRLSLLQPDIERSRGSYAIDWHIQRVSREKGERPVEHNHLIFSHRLHLDSGKVRDSQTDAALQCVDCHRLSADREHFEPIAMEQHCRQCHDLGFDAKRPNKQLPHGLPTEVFDVLEAHYLALAFDPDERPPERRRVPGKSGEENRCNGNFECAKQQAAREAERQFTQRGCVTCHKVETLAVSDPNSRWQVLPVRLATDWYPHARFDHAEHLTQTGAQGNSLCISCHRADESDSAGDILIEGLDNCTQCHTDARLGRGVTLQCVSCHGYHAKNGELRIEN